MATSTSQRVGIWIIAGIMVFGTLGAFIAPILINNNASQDSEEQKKLLEQLQNQTSTNAEPLDGYTADPFNRDGITELKVEELQPGDGPEATATSKINVNYFGWVSDGTIFDSSKKDGVTTPIDLGLDGVIPGWTEGLTGAKAGSVRKLTIPASKAYGEAGSPPKIGSNEPLTFIVQIVKVD